MSLRLLRIGGLTFIAGLIATFWMLTPLAVLIVFTHIPVSVKAGAAAFPPGYILAMFRLNLLWLVLACGLSVALATYIAPKAELYSYARAPLLFFLIFFLVIAVEAIEVPWLFKLMPGSTVATASPFHPAEFTLACFCGLVFSYLGWRFGLAGRNGPKSRIARVLERLRTLNIGRNFGKPIRLKL